MDLRLLWAVIKRFKRVSIGGTMAAVVLAVLAYGTPGPGGIKPRGSVTWESQAELLITQAGGVYGRADPKTIASQNPNYMASLSPIYTGLANGGAVQTAVRQSKVPGTVKASEGVDQNTGLYTPFITLTTSAPTAADAEKLSKIGVTAFQSYITQMEAGSGIPPSSRVVVEVIRNGLPPVIGSKPKPTIPMLVFLAIMAGTIMLLFSLENHDPQSAAKLGRVAAVAVPGGASPHSEHNGNAAGAGRAHSPDRLHRVGDTRGATLESLIKGR
jgi:hypothetical protein